MPYIIKKVDEGYKVCKKKQPNKCFSKDPLTEEQAKKQLKAIGLNSHKKGKGILTDTSIQEVEKILKEINARIIKLSKVREDIIKKIKDLSD